MSKPPFRYSRDVRDDIAQAQGLITHAFVWEKSKRGEVFWAEVSAAMSELLTERKEPR